jgi:alpha-tubulin suppressor-like RCC1 family protein
MITNTGEIYVSGYNGNGQLGIGNYSTYNTIAVKSKNMDQTKLIDSKAYHSIASDRSGFVYTTGYNAQGQLGNGTYTQSNEFTVIGDTYVHLSENRISIEEGKDKQVTASLDNKFNLINDTVDSGNISYFTFWYYLYKYCCCFMCYLMCY